MALTCVCGMSALLSEVIMDEKKFLENYNIKKYEQPSAAADIAVFTVMDVPEENYRKLNGKKLCLLMIKRGKPPYEGYYALPGGFAKKTESLEETAARELFEETSVKDISITQLKTTSTPGRDKRGWIISCGYIALVDSTKITVKSGDDADDARWFEVNFDKFSEDVNETSIKENYNLKLVSGDITLSCEIERRISFDESGKKEVITAKNPMNIAFDHAEIIGYAIFKLRKMTEYEFAAFSLMPKKFTVADLQRVYESIMGEDETDTNFRRKMMNYLIACNEEVTGVGHRPSKLYERNYKMLLGK